MSTGLRLSDDGDSVTEVDRDMPAGLLAELHQRLEDAVVAEAAQALEVGLAPFSESNLVVDAAGSVVGVFAATHRELPEGAQVPLILVLPGERRVEVQARVSATCGGGAGLGLAFETRLDPETANLLEDFASCRDPLLIH